MPILLQQHAREKNILYSLNQERLQRVQEVLHSFMIQSHEGYPATYARFVTNAINQLAPEPRLETFEDLLSWMCSFAQKLCLYHEALKLK